MHDRPPQEQPTPEVDLRHALRERVKELACLYDVSALLARSDLSTDRKLQAVVERLPAGWQHPEAAIASLRIDDRLFTTHHGPPGDHGLPTEILVGGRPVGWIEVAYAPTSSGPAPAFLEEEKLLIAEIARRIGTFLEHEWGRQRMRSLEERLQGPGELSQGTVDAQRGPQGLIGASASMLAVYRAIEKAAETDATILILGESGTGKELVARAIHYASARSTAPFVPVNCAAIPETLVESELFGYVKGAFTGATTARAGFFQTAEGGTVFLDEIGETSLAVQAKLLRVLEDKQVRMVGSDRAVHVDTRIVAATNEDIPALVALNRFRADLFFRLNVLSIELPALRERPEDLPLLLEHFQEKWGPRSGGRTLTFSERALHALQRYDWPGNVRELENLVHRLTVMVDGGFVDVSELPETMRSATSRAPRELRSLREVEREHVQRVLDAADGNRSRAARILGIDRKTLRKKLGEG